jgi:hypothetical protein
MQWKQAAKAKKSAQFNSFASGSIAFVKSPIIITGRATKTTGFIGIKRLFPTRWNGLWAS